MYRLLVYGLISLSGLGIVLSFAGTLSYSGKGMLISLTTLLLICYVTNKVLAHVWQVATNSESWLITALILFCILPPATTVTRFLSIELAGLLAMASKYMVAWRGKHIFNPAAFGATIIGAAGFTYASWWIGSSVLWPFTLIFGLLVLRKIRRFSLFFSFVVVSLIGAVAVSHSQNFALIELIKQTITVSPLIFLGTIMLTEPATTPPKILHQVIYGVLIGVLFSTHWNILGTSITPEFSLIIGNLFSYAVSPKYKLRLKLAAKQSLSKYVTSFNFVPDQRLQFEAGQCMEWTLPHRHQDNRGNRRTFTIASSPTEDEVIIGVKFNEKASSFKRYLYSLQTGDTVIAGQLSGDFTMPKNSNEKLVFIAGGIGITPFRSMAKYLIDTKQKRDIVLFYLINSPDEASYTDIFEAAKPAGIKTVKVLSSLENAPRNWGGKIGRLTPELLNELVPDFRSRKFYLSGPNAMVENYVGMLKRAGIKRRRIITDYFSGY